MAFVGLWLAAVGIADWVAGLSGRVESPARGITGWIAGSVVSVSAMIALGPRAPGTFVGAAWVALTVGGWLWVRRRKDEGSARAGVTLSLFFGMALGTILLSAAVQPIDTAGLDRALERMPFDAFSRQSSDALLLAGGILLWLTATANALVRLVLLATSSNLQVGEQKLKGGRIIGPMERWLIFGFALAGAPTAAAIVVAAKSLLRFPEVSSAARIDEVTEYFLVGSLTSWLLALAPVLLFL